MLVFHASSLAHELENAVHAAQRVEHRLQRRAAALPAGVRRLLAGGLAGAAGKTSTAPLEAVKMRLVQSGDLGTARAASMLWRHGGVKAFFKRVQNRRVLGGVGPQQPAAGLHAPAPCHSLCGPALGDALTLFPPPPACAQHPPKQGQWHGRPEDHPFARHRAVHLRISQEAVQVGVLRRPDAAAVMLACAAAGELRARQGRGSACVLLHLCLRLPAETDRCPCLVAPLQAGAGTASRTARRTSPTKPSRRWLGAWPVRWASNAACWLNLCSACTSLFPLLCACLPNPGPCRCLPAGVFASTLLCVAAGACAAACLLWVGP